MNKWAKPAVENSTRNDNFYGSELKEFKPAPKKKPSRLTLIILAGVAIILAGSAIYAVQDTLLFMFKAQAATGTITSLVPSSTTNRGSKRTYYAVVSFQTRNGNSIEARTQMASFPPAGKVGENITVFYDPAVPTRIRLDSFMDLWFVPLLLTGCGLVVAIFAIMEFRTPGTFGRRRK